MLQINHIMSLVKVIRISGHSLNSSCKKIKMEKGAFKIDNSNFQVPNLITDYHLNITCKSYANID